MYRMQTSTPAMEGKRDNFHYDIMATVQPHQTYIAAAWFKADGDLRPSLGVATENWQTSRQESAPYQRVAARYGPLSRSAREPIGRSVCRSLAEEKRIAESEVGISYCDEVALYPADANDLRAMRQCRVTVNAKSVLHEINPLFFGVNTLFWIEDDASLNDGQLAKYLAEMPCRLMRLPRRRWPAMITGKCASSTISNSFPIPRGRTNSLRQVHGPLPPGGAGRSSS